MKRRAAHRPWTEGVALSFKDLVVAGSERIVHDRKDLFPAASGPLQALRREILPPTEPLVGLCDSWLRLEGPIRPAREVPAAWRGRMAP